MCRCSAQSSSWKLPSFRLLQIAFHSSYWVTESKPRLADVRRVVPVDDFADEPRVTELLPNPRQHLRPEPVGDGVGGVEAPSVGSTTQPMRHHIDGVVDDVGVVVVERDQFAVTLERLEVAAGVAEPRGVVILRRRRGSAESRFRHG